MRYEVLIIEDDPIFIMMTKRIIESTGFHPAPLTFQNSKDALALMHENSNLEVHYTIFLDINMPEMNGWDFLESIRHKELSKYLQVFMVTSSSSTFDKIKASKYPCVLDYIEKPITKTKIAQLMESGLLKDVLKRV